MPAEIHEAWRRFVEGIGLPPAIAEPLLDPDRIDGFCQELPTLGLARQAHACTHTTVAPKLRHWRGPHGEEVDLVGRCQEALNRERVARVEPQHLRRSQRMARQQRTVFETLHEQPPSRSTPERS